MAEIGIICAMTVEAELLRSRMTDRLPDETCAGRTISLGKLGGRDVALTVCGVGKIHAAMATQMLIDRYQVGLVINTGIAGGLGEGMQTLDLVAATQLAEHDFDMTAIGMPRGYVPESGSDGITYFPTLPAALEAFRKAEPMFPDTRFFDGTVVSGDMFLADPAYKQWLVDTFHAKAGEMEGVAVARVAAENGAGSFVLRAISDLADGDASMTYDIFEKKAADLSARVILEMLPLL